MLSEQMMEKRDWLSDLVRMKSLLGVDSDKCTPSFDTPVDSNAAVASVVDAYAPFILTLAHAKSLSVERVVSDALFKHLCDKAPIVVGCKAVAQLSTVQFGSGQFDKVDDNVLESALDFLGKRNAVERTCKRLCFASRALKCRRDPTAVKAKGSFATRRTRGKKKTKPRRLEMHLPSVYLHIEKVNILRNFGEICGVKTCKDTRALEHRDERSVLKLSWFLADYLAETADSTKEAEESLRQQFAASHSFFESLRPAIKKAIGKRKKASAVTEKRRLRVSSNELRLSAFQNGITPSVTQTLKFALITFLICKGTLGTYAAVKSALRREPLDDEISAIIGITQVLEFGGIRGLAAKSAAVMGDSLQTDSFHRGLGGVRTQD